MHRGTDGQWELTTHLDTFNPETAGLWHDQEVRSTFLGRLLRPADGSIPKVTPLKDQQHVHVGHWGDIAFFNVEHAELHHLPDQCSAILVQKWQCSHASVMAW